MAHQHHDPPSHGRFGEAAAVGHPSGGDEYLVTPPGAGHEHTDASVWIIAKFGLWLAVAAVIIHIGLFVVFGLLVQQREETDHAFPLAVGQAQRLPAAPRLQTIPVNEAYEFRLQEDSVLRNYGWIDRNAGLVQIPIEEAMRLTVERGLPSRAAPADQAPAGTTAPGFMPADSSAGRTMERRR